MYTAPDDRCPECGTSLVAVAARPRRRVARLVLVDDPEHAERPPIGGATEPEPRPGRTPWPARSLVSAVIATAFVSGLLLPNRSTEGDGARSADAPVILDLALGRASDAGGIALTLDEVVQRGRVLVANFQVRDGLDPALLERAEVAVVVGHRDAAAQSLSLGSLPVRVTPTGFQISTQLPSEDQPLRALSLTGLQIAVAGNLQWSVDVSSIWPATATNEPRVLRVRKDVRVDGRLVSLVFLLAWRDRLEALFDISDLNASGRLEYEFDEYRLSWRDPVTGIVEVRHEIGARGPLGQLEIEFEPFPVSVGEITIGLSDASRVIEGVWSWVTPVRGV